MIERTDATELADVRRELVTIRQLLISVVHAIREAESEIPEKMRRFANYMHDLHDIKFMYEEHGQQAPEHLNEDLRRCDDRYRQLLKELNLEGGAFEKVRRKMAEDEENRWDHTRLLAKPQENGT